jgi:hypothetical protein
MKFLEVYIFASYSYMTEKKTQQTYDEAIADCVTVQYFDLKMPYLCMCGYISCRIIAVVSCNQVGPGKASTKVKRERHICDK